jgi:hypothetical protein
MSELSRVNLGVFRENNCWSDIDAVIYCTGYKASFLFWNERVNGEPLFGYVNNHLLGVYQYTFSRNYPHTLRIVSIPRVLTFRSFEYQAIALVRLFAGRNAVPLPPLSEQDKREKDRAELVKKENRKFHDIPWDNNETMDWFQHLFNLSGLTALEGWGRCPPVLGERTRWAIENIRKYPEPGKDRKIALEDEVDWVVVDTPQKGRDSLHFI